MAVVYSGSISVGNSLGQYGYSTFLFTYGSISDGTADMYAGASTVQISQALATPYAVTLGFSGDVTGGWDSVTFTNSVSSYTIAYSSFTRSYNSSFGVTQYTLSSHSSFIPGFASVSFSFDGTPAITAPVISSVSSSNASASSVNAEIKLSSAGSGGTLQFAQTTTNAVPATGWQSGSSFSHKRGTTRYYWASQDQDTAGTYDGSGAIFIGYIAPDTTVTFANSALTISSGQASATVGLQTVTSGENYQVRNQAGTATYATQLASSTSVNITFSTGLPTVGNTLTYQIYSMRPNSIGGDDAYDATGDFFTVERLTADPLQAPTSISFEADPGTSVSTLNLAVTAAGGGGTMQVSDDNSTWLSNGSDIPFRRGIANTVYARSVSGAQTSSVISSSLTLSYIASDTTVSPVSTTISSSQASASIVVNNVTSGETYQIRNTAGTVTYQSNTASGTSVTITQTTGLPAEGTATSYTIYSLRPNSLGGSGSYTATGDNFTITRTDGTPNAFSFTDVGSASRSSEVNTYVQITGISETVTASRTSGTATFAVSSTTSTPTSGFSSTAKTITNNQYLHVKEISSDTLGATKSSTFSVGGVSDNWNVTTTTSAADFTVNVSYSDEGIDEFINFNVTGPTGGRSGQTSGTAIYIQAGQTVNWYYTSTPVFASTLDVIGLDSFTNNTSITNISSGTTTALKTWNTGITPGTVDSISMTAGAVGETVYFAQAYLTPDTSVTFCSEITVATAATSFVQTVTEVSPNNNSASTVYSITSGASTLASRTGPGNITVNDVPTFLGVPKSYGLVAALPTSAGGNSSKYVVGTFDVIRGTAPGANPPNIDSYGIAIYDHNEVFVTSFTEESTILREIYSGSATTSTSGVTNINTGLSGLSSGNALAIITYDIGLAGGADGFKNISSTFVSGSILQIARDSQSATNLDITVLQYKGATVNGTSPDYGVEIYNQNGDLVIDELASYYAVREVIDCDPANSNITFYQGSNEFSTIVVTLVENRYPLTGGVPIPAIQGPGLSLLIPPTISTIIYTSSYKYVIIYIPAYANPANFSLAMLTERNNTTPQYYGGTASDYGLQVKDSSGNVTWDSSWRQAIVNNIVPANQFTTGCSGQLTYDVTSGYDGVVPPLYTTSDVFETGLQSTGEGKTITGLNQMDPTNTFLLGGGMVTGKVSYYTGLLFDGETSYSANAGGGIHAPAATIISNSGINITMVRMSDGPVPPAPENRGTRYDKSFHPDGFFVFARIT